ncbi:MAG: acyl carrier protein [Deltaproteobacteria bacterium]|nr:acyl carrier protein [Deltaproteobacteria bacterium]
MSRPSSDELLASLARLIRQVSPVGPKAPITRTSRLREDLALDSVASLELLSLIDDELGLCLEMEDVIGIETVGGILALAETRLGVEQATSMFA